MTYTIREVFTPTTPATITFVDRESINDRLISALMTPGKQVIVYGHSGCGKTTVLLNKLRQTYEAHVTTRCMSGLTFGDLVEDAICQINGSYEAEQTLKVEEKITARLGTEILGTNLGSAGTSKSRQIQKKQKAIVPSRPTPQVLAQLLGREKACWVLEDFHKIDRKEKHRMSQVMKLFMDAAVDYPELKVIAIGAVDTAREVIEYDNEMRNRIAEIHVPLMTQSELIRIIEKGEEALNVEFEYRVRRGIVQLSNGLASACHHICLNYCEANGITETQPHYTPLGTDNYRKAIQNYLTEASDTLKSAFDKAFKTFRHGKYNHGKLILRALTKFDQDGATRGEVLEQIRTVEPGYPQKHLTSLIDSLTREQRGSILRFDPNSGRYSYSEPIHRAFAASFFEMKARTPVPGLSQLDKMIHQLIPGLSKALSRIEKTKSNDKNGA